MGNFVTALNSVSLNILAMVAMGVGVFLIMKGIKDSGMAIIMSAFAIIRGGGDKKTDA